MDKQTEAQLNAIDSSIATLKLERDRVLEQYYKDKPSSFQMSFGKLIDMKTKARVHGINATTLLIATPNTPHITIGDNKLIVTDAPVIGTVYGIEVMIEGSLKQGQAYLIDKHSYKKIFEGGKKQW